MADRTYVLVIDGRVQERIALTEESIRKFGGIEARFHPEFVSRCVETTGLLYQPPQGWLWDDKAGRFAMPLSKDGVTPVAPRVFGAENLMEIIGGEKMP